MTDEELLDGIEAEMREARLCLNSADRYLAQLRENLKQKERQRGIK